MFYAPLFLAAAALAAPSSVDERQAYVPCSGLYGSAQCCATDVLGLANLDCGERTLTIFWIFRSFTRRERAADETKQQTRLLPTLTTSRPCARRSASARDAACCPSSTRAFSATRLLVLRTKEWRLTRQHLELDLVLEQDIKKSVHGNIRRQTICNAVIYYNQSVHSLLLTRMMQSGRDENPLPCK